MAILFTIFVALNLLLGWSRELSSQPFARQFLVWSCVLTSLVFGVLAEWLVARWRFAGPGERRWRNSLRYIATNWLVAIGIGIIVLAVLALPVFDSMRVIGVVVSVVAIEFVAVCALASIFNARRQAQPSKRAAFLRDFGNYALLNIVSMAAGVGAGRLYLNLFYPGVG